MIGKKPAVQGIHSVQPVLLDNILEHAWIMFDSGKISGYAQGEPPDAAECMAGAHLYLSSGLIDLHLHGGNKTLIQAMASQQLHSRAADMILARCLFTLGRPDIVLCNAY